MLKAVKTQLLTGYHRDTLTLWDNELQYWLTVYARFGTLASLLAGFASATLVLAVNPSFWKHVETTPSYLIPVVTLPHLLFVVSICGAVGCHFLLLSVCTLLWSASKRRVLTQNKIPEAKPGNIQ